MEKSQDDLRKEVDEKIIFGNTLIDKLNSVSSIDGAPKVQRKIKQEITFLKKLKSSEFIKKEQLLCSNLRHLAAVVECALRPSVIAISKIFHSSNGDKVSIDIVSDSGKIWTKVIARNPKSLSALSDGNASYGARSVLDQAQDYLDCAEQHPCLYQTPQVIFEFVSGIEDLLAKKLQELGIIVKGMLIPTIKSHIDESDSECSESDGSEDWLSNQPSPICDELRSTYNKTTLKNSAMEVNTLNLDVTTMMAYISNLTNGHYNFVYKQPLLSQQAVWEAKRPVKPELEKIFKGKDLVCCQAAWDDFSKIVNTLGGPNEKIRAAELREKLVIMPDDQNGPDEVKMGELKVKGRVRLRSKVVFNFGQRIRAFTVSANEGFIRSAKQQGITYAAIIHESRALTEEKEKTATPTILPIS